MTSNLPWFRLYGESVDDEKLRLLAFEDRWHFVALLCCKAQGILDGAATPEASALMRRKVAVKLGVDMRTFEEIVRRLSEVGLVEADSLQPVAWDKRQMRSDSSADRVRAYRERAKRPSNVTETASTRSGNALDKEEEKEKEEEQKQEPHAQAPAPDMPSPSIKTTTAKPKRKGAGFDAAIIELPVWLDREDWQRWVADRNNRGKRLTEEAVKLQLKNLDAYRQEGHAPRSVIDHCIAGGYQGLFPPKTSPAGYAASSPAAKRAAWSEQLRQSINNQTRPPAQDLGTFDERGNPV